MSWISCDECETVLNRADVVIERWEGGMALFTCPRCQTRTKSTVIQGGVHGLRQVTEDEDKVGWVMCQTCTKTIDRAKVTADAHLDDKFFRPKIKFTCPDCGTEQVSIVVKSGAVDAAQIATDKEPAPTSRLNVKYVGDKPGFYVMGVPASASTWIYNVANEILRNDQGEGFKALKCHGYVDCGILDGIAPYRDFRDVLVSLTKKLCRNIDPLPMAFDIEYEKMVRYHQESQHQITDLYQCSKDERVYLVRYENYFPGRELELFTYLNDIFNITRDLTLWSVVEPRYNIATVQRNTQDRKWKMFNQWHVTNKGQVGGWRQWLKRKHIDRVADWLVPMLIDFGYEEDDKWIDSLE